MRLGEQIKHIGVLDDAPGVHDANHVRVLRHHPQIVGDEHHRHAPLALQFLQ